LGRASTKEQLDTGAAESIDAALRNLAWVVSGSTKEERNASAERVLALVFLAYLNAQEGKDATVISTRWLQAEIRRSSDLTAKAIEGVRADVAEGLGASRVFELNVESIHPWHREVPRRVRPYWPYIEIVVQALVASDDPGDLMDQWAQHLPDWPPTPPEVFAWLGDLASSHTRPTAAAVFFGRAIDLGIPDGGYWVARQAIVLSHHDPEAARQVLETFASAHPLASGVRSVLSSNEGAALGSLEVWEPTREPDITLRLVLLAQCYFELKDHNKAVQLAREAATNPDASAASIFATQVLLNRAQREHSATRQADIETALELALRARQGRRKWRQDSPEAAVWVIVARVMSGDLDGAVRATLSSPLGEATSNEEADERVRGHAARLAAMDGRFEDARSRAEGLNDPFIVMEIQARELQANEQRSESLECWAEAYDLAQSDADRLATAFEVALIGGSLPDLTPLEVDYSRAVDEIRWIQHAMAATEDRLQVLRALSNKSPLLTVKLAEVYGDEGDHISAARVLEDGGKRWTHSRLMLMAAHKYRQAEEGQRAIAAAHAAMAMGTPRWVGRVEAYSVLLNSYVAIGDLESATVTARALVALDPNDDRAVWALVQCLHWRGNAQEAWEALRSRGEPLTPAIASEAEVWIRLVAAFGAGEDLLDKILDVYERWADDERLAGLFFIQIIFVFQRGEADPSEQESARLEAAMASYFDRFPDSAMFRRVAIDPERPLEALRDLVRAQHERIEPLTRSVIDGAVPLGCLADVLGRTYLEVSVMPSRGVFLCEEAEKGPAVWNAAGQILNSGVVLDTTAAYTLTVLDETTRLALMGAFATIMTTDQAYMDALAGEHMLGRRPTMSLLWDAHSKQPVPVEIPPKEADAHAEAASAVRNLLESVQRHPRASQAVLPEWPTNSAWLANLDLAHSEGVAIWSDDLALRKFAEAKGVPCISTVQILRILAASGGLMSDELRLAEAVLVSKSYVDLGCDLATLRSAVRLAGGRPRGVGPVLARPATWKDPDGVVTILFEAVEPCAGDDWPSVEGWFEAAGHGLVRIVDVPDEASKNLAILLHRALEEPWFRTDLLPVVLLGLRRALRDRPDVADPLEVVLADKFRAWSEASDFIRAQGQLMNLVFFLRQEDKDTASRVILTSRTVELWLPNHFQSN
jgi:hypothetical protein